MLFERLLEESVIPSREIAGVIGFMHIMQEEYSCRLIIKSIEEPVFRKQRVKDIAHLLREKERKNKRRAMKSTTKKEAEEENGNQSK